MAKVDGAVHHPQATKLKEPKGREAGQASGRRGAPATGVVPMEGEGTKGDAGGVRHAIS